MSDNISCCGTPVGDGGAQERNDMVLRVRSWHWDDLLQCLTRWQDINDRINNAPDGPDKDELMDQEFEVRGELCDAAERLVEHANKEDG